MKIFKFIFGIIGAIVVTMAFACVNPVNNGTNISTTGKGNSASVTISAPGVSSTLRSALSSSSYLDGKISQIFDYHIDIFDSEKSTLHSETYPVSAFPVSIDKLPIGETTFVITACNVGNVVLAKGYISVLLVAGPNNIKVTLEWESDADITIEIEFAPIVQVYNVGYSYASGNLDIAYWVNGSRKTIMPAAFFVGKRGNYGVPQAITVSNGKMYVAGNGFWWNNSGSIHELSFPPNTDNASQSWASANAITVFNNNVYMAGYNWEPVEISHVTGPHFDDKPRACFWVNETVFNFSDNILPSIAMAITVSGDKIYTAGYTSYNDHSFRACYWINTGIAQILQIPENYSYSIPNAITVSNNNVYIAGSYGRSQYSEQACYWANSEINFLQVPGGTVWSRANAITVVGNKIYVAGFYCEGNLVEFTQKACYWDEKGIFYDLHPNNAKFSYSNSITVSNGYVYIAGIYNESYKHDRVVYWKNGTMYDLGLMDDGFRYGSLQSYLVLLE